MGLSRDLSLSPTTMLTAKAEDVKDAGLTVISNSDADRLALENIELRRELEEAQALVLKLRTENNHLASERNQAMLKRLKTSTPQPLARVSLTIFLLH